MFTIRKATVADYELIHMMAKEVFPATYKDILSPEQLDYMMDWMYAPSNVRKQMEEEGMCIPSPIKRMSHADTSLCSNRKKMYSIFRKSMFSPAFRVRIAAVSYLRKQSNASRRCTRNLV